MSPLYQMHLSVHKTIFDLKEACLELAKRLDQEGADYEEVRAAYVQAEKYYDVLRTLEDFVID